MAYEALRNELHEYYYHHADRRAEEFCVHALPLMDAQYHEGMNAYKMKEIQYRVIAAECDPVLFAADPFYYDPGMLPAQTDGARDFHGTRHAGGWTYWKNSHKFYDQDHDLWDLRWRQGGERLYLICGPYCDTSQHFNLHYAPILTGGLVSLYEKAEAQLVGATEDEAAYLHATMTGLLAIRQISEKFAEKAKKKLETATDATERAYLTRIADSAAYAPWNAPRTFYEALNTLAFLRKVIGALEGVGFNTFGRVDVELLPFYEADVAAGRLTKGEAKDLIARFLLSFDCCYDHDMKMVGYADHEFENTYTLGGCDVMTGEPIWNDLTELFLVVTREEKIIFPKVKCRYSAASPKAYLDTINEDVIHGTSSILYQNDDATIPALLRYGRTLEEARGYLVTGCWGVMPDGCEKSDNGSYVNLFKPFEFSLHKRTDKNEAVGIDFAPIDDAQDFEEVYQITLDNFRKLLFARANIVLRGKTIWNKVDPLPIYSAPLHSCLDRRRDYTAGGAKYQEDQYTLVGFPNIVDSLLAIRTLCFEDKVCTLSELLTAIRVNWEGYETLRAMAIHKCPFWGDGTPDSFGLAKRLNDDLYDLAEELPPTLWGGRTEIGHLTYTEIRFWAENTLATPDGRRNGEYFSQGLTPSRLHSIDSVTQVIDSLGAIDASKLAANSVVNVLLPSASSGDMTLDLCESFLRACAGSSLQCLQLNCVSREELLDAQKYPEKHQDLIIRVCGFSARFTSLSPAWQEEVLSRNFYNG